MMKEKLIEILTFQNGFAFLDNDDLGGHPDNDDLGGHPDNDENWCHLLFSQRAGPPRFYIKSQLFNSLDNIFLLN